MLSQTRASPHYTCVLAAHRRAKYGVDRFFGGNLACRHEAELAAGETIHASAIPQDFRTAASFIPLAVRDRSEKKAEEMLRANGLGWKLPAIGDDELRITVTDNVVGSVEAEHELESCAAKWDAKNPTISRQWRLKWPRIATMFEMPRPIRRVMYTTNLIESVNSVTRKFTRSRKQYPNRDSALKMIYMAISESSQRWTMAIHNWKEALNHFAILFEHRMPKDLA